MRSLGEKHVLGHCVIQSDAELRRQNPQCEGYFQDRVLFDAELSESRAVHVVHRDGKVYTLAAGSVHGVSPGSVYAVYAAGDQATLGKAPLGFLRVSQVHSTKSTLVPTSDTTPLALLPGHSAYALQHSAGVEQSLTLHATAEHRTSLLQVVDRHMQDFGEVAARPLDIRFNDHGAADLAVTINAAELHVSMLYPPIQACGLHELPFGIALTPGDVYDTLSAALHFFWHLKRTSPQQPLRGQVDIEFHRLREVPPDGDFDEPTYGPHGSNLNVASMITLLVDNNAAYGITLVNNSSFPLYPSLFYFSGSDLSIGT